MPLKLNGSTSGYTQLQAPATAGNNTLTLPTGNGTNGQFMQTDGSGNLMFATALTSAPVTSVNTFTGAVQSVIVAGTAVASTSGTSITFSSIPSWVKRITVMLNGVSTNGASNLQIQIGSGSVTASGYTSSSVYSYGGNNPVTTSATTGFVVYYNSASYSYNGAIVLTLISSNTWISNHTIGNLVGSISSIAGGGSSPALSGALDRVVITTVGGTDTFDAGSINILYE